MFRLTTFFSIYGSRVEEYLKNNKNPFKKEYCRIFATIIKYHIMKKIAKVTFIALLSVSGLSATAQIPGLGNILSELGKDSTITNTLGGLFNTQGSSNTTPGNTGEVLNFTLEDVVSGVIGSNKELTVNDLAGTWTYTAPACKFVSEDFLEAAGGELVAGQAAEKLSPIYTKLGFTATTFNFVFDAEGGYVMNYKKIPLSGNVTKSEKAGYFALEFVKLGNKSLVTIPTYISIKGDKMEILFEVDKFVELFRSVVGRLGINSLNTVFQLVDRYDGIMVGFELVKK